MNELRFGLADLVCLILVVGCAAGVRAGYVANPRNLAFVVQGTGPKRAAAEESDPARTHLEELVHNLSERRWFGGLTPLTDSEEETADVAPGHPWLLSLAWRIDDEPAMLIRWIQVGLGTLTVLCYFFFARRAFGGIVAGTVAGLLGAVYPFWIINTAELTDGVLATFLLAAALTLGTRGSQVGGAFTSLVFGVTLAAMALVRAALMPFAVIAFVWYLVRCRDLRGGWFSALLVLLGFANGLAPWTLRNWRVFHEPIPVVDSAYLHLWMGNNPRATGGTLDEPTLRASLPEELRDKVLRETEQPRRYALLAPELFDQVIDDPQAALGHRIDSTLCFALGERWLHGRTLVEVESGPDIPVTPEWLVAGVQTTLRASILVLLLVGAIGWRLSAAWGWHSRLAALATIWIPLPYILGHADALSGPRLPLDGVLLCYVAVAVAWLVPGFARSPAAAERMKDEGGRMKDEG